jgi:molecular chaperone DnaK
LEIREKLSGSGTSLIYLVKKGDALPKKDTTVRKACVALRAKGQGSLNFKLYEGEIESPIDDNEFIGCLKITGADFDAGVIEPGADLICEYEVSDSGRVSLSISVPSVGGTFERHDFYSRQEGQIDYSNAGQIVLDESESLMERADNISEKVNDDRLDIAKNKLQESRELAQNENDPEAVKQAMQNVHEAKRIIANVRKEHLPSIRQIDLENVIKFFQQYVKEYAKPSECTSFDNMARSAKLSMERPGSDFENMIDQMRGMNWEILWRQDWFVIDKFKRFSNEEYLFTDRVAFRQLVTVGIEAIKSDKIDKLREVVFAMYAIRISTHAEQDLNLQTNIL